MNIPCIELMTSVNFEVSVSSVPRKAVCIAGREGIDGGEGKGFISEAETSEFQDGLFTLTPGSWEEGEIDWLST